MSERAALTNQMKEGPSDWLTQWKAERERDDFKSFQKLSLPPSRGAIENIFKSAAAADHLYRKLGSSLVLMQSLASGSPPFQHKHTM